MPLLLIQSCESANKVALKCREHKVVSFPGKDFNHYDDRYYIIDYNKNQVFGFTNKEIYAFDSLMIAPEAITFTIPIDDDPMKYSIDRTSLAITAERTTNHSLEKIIGKCSKTQLPNLSSYGKQI